MPLEEQRESVSNWRQIGLGIMGLGDMLVKIGLTYGENKSIILCEKIASLMLNVAIQTSALLAKDNGTFPMYDYESLIKSDFYKDNLTKESKE